MCLHSRACNVEVFTPCAASQATQLQGLYLHWIPSLDVHRTTPPTLSPAISSSIQLTSLELCCPIRLEAVSGLTRLQQLALALWHLDDGQGYDLQVCPSATCMHQSQRNWDVWHHSALVHTAASAALSAWSLSA